MTQSADAQNLVRRGLHVKEQPTATLAVKSRTSGPRLLQTCARPSCAPKPGGRLASLFPSFLGLRVDFHPPPRHPTWKTRKLPETPSVSIAFRRLVPPALRPLNPLAGRHARAMQVTTAGLGHLGPSPRRACFRVNLHNRLPFGQFGLRSGAGLFWGFWARALGRRRCGWRIGLTFRVSRFTPGSRGLFRNKPSCRRSWFLWRSGRQFCRRQCGPRPRQFWTEAGARTR